MSVMCTWGPDHGAVSAGLAYFFQAGEENKRCRWAVRGQPQAVSGRNSDVSVQTETRHAGATGAGSAVNGFRIDSISGNCYAAAGVRACGDATADRSGIDGRQPGLIAGQAIGVFCAGLLGVPAAAFSKAGIRSANACAKLATSAFPGGRKGKNSGFPSSPGAYTP